MGKPVRILRPELHLFLTTRCDQCRPSGQWSKRVRLRRRPDRSARQYLLRCARGTHRTTVRRTWPAKSVHRPWREYAVERHPAGIDRRHNRKAGYECRPVRL
ncbi:MAG: DUF746 domain-containing protein [Phycisphaerales bacterium]|nr:MAG: DUF746 domain-containing protein [Phycisphaerales bacterium]